MRLSSVGAAGAGVGVGFGLGTVAGRGRWSVTGRWSATGRGAVVVTFVGAAGRRAGTAVGSGGDDRSLGVSEGTLELEGAPPRTAAGGGTTSTVLVLAGGEATTEGDRADVGASPGSGAVDVMGAGIVVWGELHAGTTASGSEVNFTTMTTAAALTRAANTP